jgi:copper chaperone CopZ
MNFEGKKNFNIQHPLFNIHNSGPYLPYLADLSHRSFSEGGWLLTTGSWLLASEIFYPITGGLIMATKSFFIPNISCGHCVMTIKNDLKELEGVSRVEGDAQKKEVTVEWEAPATLEKIRSTLKEINYPVAD